MSSFYMLFYWVALLKLPQSKSGIQYSFLDRTTGILLFIPGTLFWIVIVGYSTLVNSSSPAGLRISCEPPLSVASDLDIRDAP
jgi:hypothetical protein